MSRFIRKRRGEAMLSPVGATERESAKMVCAEGAGPGTKCRGGSGRVPIGRTEPQAVLSPVGATERESAKMVCAEGAGPGTKCRGGSGRVPIGRTEPQAVLICI
jgi:hypothetical protein